MMSQKDRKLRIGDLQMIFEICKEEFQNWKLVEDEIRKLENHGKHFKFVEIENKQIPLEVYVEERGINKLKSKRRKYYTKTIIFVAIYLEAFIYDYGATRLGNSYMSKHLERVDVQTKWRIIPKLITNEEIQTENHNYGLLKKIISQRNKLVHNKSKELKTVLKKMNEKVGNEDEIGLLSCFECIEYLLSEIYRIDPNFDPLVNNLDELKVLIRTT